MLHKGTEKGFALVSFCCFALNKCPGGGEWSTIVQLNSLKTALSLSRLEFKEGCVIQEHGLPLPQTQLQDSKIPGDGAYLS